MKTTTLLILTSLLTALHASAQFYPNNNRDKPAREIQKPDTLPAPEGYVNYSQAGIGVRLGKPVFSISTVNGYQFSRHIAIGGGVGYSRNYVPLWNVRVPEISTGMLTLNNIRSSTTVNVDQLDLFAEIRLLLGKKGSASLFLDFGYSVLLSGNRHVLTPAEESEWLTQNPNSDNDTLVNSSYTDRFYGAPGVGWRFALARNMTLNIALQLYVSLYKRGQETKQNYGSGAHTTVDNITKASLYPLFTIGIGFLSESKGKKTAGR